MYVYSKDTDTPHNIFSNNYKISKLECGKKNCVVDDAAYIRPRPKFVPWVTCFFYVVSNLFKSTKLVLACNLSSGLILSNLAYVYRKSI